VIGDKLLLNERFKRLHLNGCDWFRLSGTFKSRRLRAAFKGIGPGGAILNTLKGCDIPARGNAPGMFGKKNIRPVGAGHSVSDGEGLCSALTGLNLFVMSVPGALPRAGMCSPFRAGETFKSRRLRVAFKGIALSRAGETFKGRRLRAAFKGRRPSVFV